MWNVWERKGIHTGICLGNLKEIDRFKVQVSADRIMLKWIFKK